MYMQHNNNSIGCQQHLQSGMAKLGQKMQAASSSGLRNHTQNRKQVQLLTKLQVM
jgi:hypothetical protein